MVDLVLLVLEDEQERQAREVEQERQVREVEERRHRSRLVRRACLRECWAFLLGWRV